MADDQGRVVIVDDDGKRHVFPAGFDPKRAAWIVAQATKPREPGVATIGDQMAAKGTTLDNVGTGLWNATKGMAQTIGKASGIPGMLREGPWGAIKDQAEVAKSMFYDAPAAEFEKARTAPSTSEAIGHAVSGAIPLAGPMIGHASEMIGEGRSAELAGELIPLALTAGAIKAAPKVMGAVSEAIPSTARAGGKFQSVMKAAGDVPVKTDAAGNVALRVAELSERAGGQLPKGVNNFIKRISDPAQPPMTYSESRDYASGFSRLSAKDYQRIGPGMGREIATLSKELNKANADAAKAVGKLDEYQSAMKEYAKAKQIEGVMKSLSKGVKQGLPWATGTGLGLWAERKLEKLLSGAGQ